MLYVKRFLGKKIDPGVVRPCFFYCRNALSRSHSTFPPYDFLPEALSFALLSHLRGDTGWGACFFFFFFFFPSLSILGQSRMASFDTSKPVLPYKRTRMPHLSMFAMLYLEKKIPQPPPESFYINRRSIYEHRTALVWYPGARCKPSRPRAMRF